MIPTSFRWQWHWGIVLLVALVLSVTISLGFWQLQRAEEKRNLLDEHEAQMALPPLLIETELPEVDANLRYRRVTLTALLDNERLLLLDNRPRRGRQGLEVHALARVLDRDGNLGDFSILVNRGWIETGLERAQLPDIPKVEGVTQLQGYLYQPPSEALLLADDRWPKDVWPLVVQSIDLDQAERRLGVELPPYTLRLSPVNSAALEADWPVVIDGPGRHVGYAVQWFVMATVLFILAIFANSNLLQVLTKRAGTQGEDRG